MGRYRALLAATWWLWLVFAALGIGLTAALGRVFLLTFPIFIGTFLWFGFVRYDNDGTFKGS